MKESAKQRPRGTILPVQRAVRVKSAVWENWSTGRMGAQVVRGGQFGWRRQGREKQSQKSTRMRLSITHFLVILKLQRSRHSS